MPADEHRRRPDPVGQAAERHGEEQVGQRRPDEQERRQDNAREEEPDRIRGVPEVTQDKDEHRLREKHDDCEREQGADRVCEVGSR